MTNTSFPARDPSISSLIPEVSFQINKEAPKEDTSQNISLQTAKIPTLAVPQEVKAHQAKKVSSSVLTNLFLRIFPKKDLTGLVAATQLRVKHIRETIVRLDGNNKLLVVSKGIFLPKKETQYSIKASKLAKTALKQGAHKKVEVLTSGGASTAVALQPWGWNEETQKMEKGCISSTNEEKGIHLTNCYTTVFEHDPDSGSGKKTGVIRTGVIDNDQKVEEFRKLVDEVYGEIRQTYPEPPLRIVSHQLNSPEREHKLIIKQHGLLAELDDELGGGKIVHIDSPTNRLYNFTKFTRKLGAVGKFIENRFLKGEKIAKEQNLEGWCTYLQWLGEDLKRKGGEGFAKIDLSILHKKSIFLKECIKRLEETSKGEEQLIKNLKRKKNLFEKQLHGLRKSLRDALVDQYQKLESIEKDLTPKDPSYRKVVLMRKILGHQLDIKGAEKISRGAEEMMIQLLNDELNVISAINCKSGLDRTGLLHNVKLALLQQQSKMGMKLRQDGELDSEEKAAKAIFDMVVNWDANTKKLNEMASGVKADEDSIKKMNSLIKKKDEEGKLNLIVEFREFATANLLKLGLTITGIDKGAVGVKWPQAEAIRQ